MTGAKIHYLFTPMGKQPDTSDLPNRIRERRRAYRTPDGRKLSAGDLGERIGMTGAHVGHLETGKRALTYPHMVAIARVLECAVADLLRPEDHDVFLSQDERQLIEDYRALEAPNRRAVRGLADNLKPYRAEPEDLSAPPSPATGADRRRA
jgi:DNA-binding Xre family transcriptional regulator